MGYSKDEENHKDAILDQKVSVSQQAREQALDALAKAPLRRPGKLEPEEEGNWRSTGP